MQFNHSEVAFVGDVHSQYLPLQTALNHYASEGAHVVLLGDLNDSPFENYEGTSFLTVFRMAFSFVESGHGTLIQSNHQHNLWRILEGRRTKCSEGMRSTLRELRQEGWIDCEIDDEIGYVSIDWISESAAQMAQWLKSRPFVYENPTLNVVGVHAYYSDVPEDMRNRKWREKCLYGITRRVGDSNERVRWWEEDRTGKPFVVAGHYHEVYHGDNCAVVDSGCGSNGVDIPLLSFEYPSKEFQSWL